jgi:hypothetical protein
LRTGKDRLRNNTHCIQETQGKRSLDNINIDGDISLKFVMGEYQVASSVSAKDIVAVPCKNDWE